MDKEYIVSQEKIPKIIHYCWFGHNDKSEKIKGCLNSWKRYCPTYEIIEWNEENYDVNNNEYIKAAYSKGKWAFVSDFARLDVVYKHGGIYLDTDVELIKSLDELRSNEAFAGFEDNYSVNTGLGFGAVKGNPMIKEVMDLYLDTSFFLKNGDMNLKPCTYYFTKILVKYGLIQDGNSQICGNFLILSAEYFNPKKLVSDDVNITYNTFSINHASMSWMDENEKKKIEKERMIYRKYGKGIWRIYHGIILLRRVGFRETMMKTRNFFKGIYVHH